MNHERNVGVSEARLGLSLVICLLVVLGYMILHYLGGTRQAPALEFRTGIVAEPLPASHAVTPEADQQPQVLTIESNDLPGHAQRTSPDESELR
jgi:hypothetical protein